MSYLLDDDTWVNCRASVQNSHVDSCTGICIAQKAEQGSVNMWYAWTSRQHMEAIDSCYMMLQYHLQSRILFHRLHFFCCNELYANVFDAEWRLDYIELTLVAIVWVTLIFYLNQVAWLKSSTSRTHDIILSLAFHIDLLLASGESALSIQLWSICEGLNYVS